MSNQIRICIAGITGKVGRLLAAAVAEAEDLELVGGTSRTHAGSNLGSVLHDAKLDLALRRTVEEALAVSTDVLIDYTHPDAVEANIRSAIQKGSHVVVGTSGLTDDQYAIIDEEARARKRGVIAAGNFSLTGTLMQHFALIAARHVPTWEIMDFGTERKPDAPSGTARELAFRLGEVRKPHYDVPIEDTSGPTEARGASLRGSQVHSLRMPGFFSSAGVIFGMAEQRLTIRYESLGSQPYVAGTLLAARKVCSIVGLRRGLDTIIDL